MLKANFKFLLETTNIQIVAIRNSQISCYVTIFGNFGSLSSLILGFSIQALIDVKFVLQKGYNPTAYAIIRDTYYLTLVCCICTAIHILLATSLLMTMAPMLALYGRPGSMATVSTFMQTELKTVFHTAVIMLCFFNMCLITVGWAQMSFNLAVTCTVILLLSSIITYQFCKRIYAKLYTPAIFCDENSKVLDFNDINGTWIKSIVDNNNNSMEMNPVHNKVLAQPFQGYMRKLDQTFYQNINSTWSKRFFTLNAHGHLYYFRSEQHFKNAPDKPIKDRPVDVKLYNVLIGKNALHGNDWDELTISLVHKTKPTEMRVWIFR